MITVKQAEARRRNGKLSRGPKTPEGKAISSRNALKCGFLSRDPVHPAESAEEFAAFRKGMLESLAPRGESECRLAAEIIDHAWRLQRFPKVEAAIITEAFHEEVRPENRQGAGRQVVEGRAWIRSLRAIEGILRQETRIDRPLHRCFSLWRNPGRNRRAKNITS